MIKASSATHRNEQCPCTSGLKFKFCHGDSMKLAICNQAAKEKMVELITEERKKRGVVKYAYTCENCKKGTDTPDKSIIDERVLKCPFCEHTELTENKVEVATDVNKT